MLIQEGEKSHQYYSVLKFTFNVGCSLGTLLLIEAVSQALPATAQISGDGSFETLVNQSLTDTCSAALCTITGGNTSRTGSVLLHSFDQFSLSGDPTGTQEARFVDPGVADIVVRVTGSNESLINGTLSTSANSAANLFIVNPQGISFGPSAQLNLGGSFTASTADQILFDEGITLGTRSATSAIPALLNISAPVGLGFLPESRNAPISVQGTGNLLTVGSPATPDVQFVNRIFRGPPPPGVPPGAIPPFSELAVQPGQNINLVGNGVSLSGGNLTANGGQIVLGSVTVGKVEFESEGLDFRQVDTFNNIELTNRASLEVSDSNSGSVVLRGQNITVTNASAVLAETLPGTGATSTDGGLIDIDAVELVRIIDSPETLSSMSGPPFFTYLSVDVAPSATGDGGTIDLQAQNLVLENGGQLGANTFGVGNAGSLSLLVDESIEIGKGGAGPSGLFSASESTGTGNSGQIQIDAGTLKIQQGGLIQADSGSSGSSGSITIDVNQLELNGTSDPIELRFPDGSSIITFVPSSIESDSGSLSTGEGGEIKIDANQIDVTGGAKITSATEGSANAGSITVTSDEITLSGFSSEVGPSEISTTTVGENATGRGGDLTVETGALSVFNGAQVATSTFGPGEAGNLSIDSESVLVSGAVPQGRSGLFATAIGGTGNGGNLSVTADNVRVTDGGTISVGTFSSGVGAPIAPGQGNAGDLTIDSRTINLNGRASLNAETAAGDRGNINLTTRALTLRNNSQVTANAINDATGGNINIDASTGFVVAVPEENSDITANAERGNGGQVNIAAQSILGIEARPELTPLSDITASSESGLAGETQIENLEAEVRQEVDSLPESNEVAAVVQGCNARGSGTGRLVQTGRGGVSATPYGVLNSRNSLEDISIPSSLAAADSPETPAPESSARTNSARTNSARTNSERTNSVIEEAQGWEVNPQGEIVLLAENDWQNNRDRCLGWQS